MEEEEEEGGHFYCSISANLRGRNLLIIKLPEQRTPIILPLVLYVYSPLVPCLHTLLAACLLVTACKEENKEGEGEEDRRKNENKKKRKIRDEKEWRRG